MIKTITVINDKNEQVVLNMKDPFNTGFFIKSIEGLGPTRANINTTDYSTIDGSRFISARANQRNIVLNLGFLEFPTIEHSRQASYKYFPIKRSVTLIIETDLRTVMISGKVESNEPNIFSKREDCYISIICPDPYFRSLSGAVASFSSTTKQFEFPFSNESTAINLIYFGDINADVQKTVTYAGETSIGLKIVVNVNGPAGTTTVYNLGTGEQLVIDNDIVIAMTGFGLDLGDIVTIETTKGKKSVVLSRDGVDINILNAVVNNSDWFTLTNGDNSFYYSSVFGSGNLIFTIYYDTLYEGI